MKLVVCGSCEAEYQIRHSLDEHYYKLSYCPFCGEPMIDEELEDEIECEEDDLSLIHI